MFYACVLLKHYFQMTCISFLIFTASLIWINYFHIPLPVESQHNLIQPYLRRFSSCCHWQLKGFSPVFISSNKSAISPICSYYCYYQLLHKCEFFKQEQTLCCFKMEVLQKWHFYFPLPFSITCLRWERLIRAGVAMSKQTDSPMNWIQKETERLPEYFRFLHLKDRLLTLRHSAAPADKAVKKHCCYTSVLNTHTHTHTNAFTHFQHPIHFYIQINTNWIVVSKRFAET